MEAGEIRALEVFGSNLVCAADFGFELQAGRMPSSVVVLKKFGPSDLELAGRIRLKEPVFLTLEELSQARDALPLYFLEILNNYRIISGVYDPFKRLKISRKDSRLHLEQELRLKLIHLRRALFSSSPDEIFDRTPTAFGPLLAGLLFFKGIRASSFQEALRLVEIEYGTSTRIYETVYLHQGNSKQAVGQLIKFLEKLVAKIDKIR